MLVRTAVDDAFVKLTGAAGRTLNSRRLTVFSTALM